MDMFREILGFYDVVEDHELKSGAIALFFALLHRANRNGWKEWFIVSSKKLEALSGQGKTTVWSNLKVLKACGLIDYRTAKGAKTEFKIIPTRSKYEPLPEPLPEREPERLPEQEPEPPLIERAEDVDVDDNDSPLPPSGGAPAAQPLDYEKIVELFHHLCPSLPRLKVITDQRKRAMRSAHKTLSDMRAKFCHLFIAVERSDFLTGRDEKHWKGCGFDWILKQANLVKIMEDTYPNNVKKGSDGTWTKG